jgi:hypothetical protein
MKKQKLFEKRKIFVVFLFLTLLFLGWFLGGKSQKTDREASESPEKKLENKNLPQPSSLEDNPEINFSPLERSQERISKKPFGIRVSPSNSPVSPEKFSGYHTGVDFEVFPEELEADTPIKAVCSGEILEKRTASGYGGILVQKCQIDEEPVSIIYGHLNLQSVSKKTGEDLSAGETVGLLGKDKSAETGYERKHLHLGIKKGSIVNIAGYVQSRDQLSGWIDPCRYFCQDR